MKKILFLLATILIASTAALTSCSSDDEPKSTTIYYNAGFTMFDGSLLSGEMGKIESIYYNALNIKTSDFTLTGKPKECDKKVYEACKKAEEEISRTDWNCDFTFTVTQYNDPHEVYSYTYKK